MLNRTDAVELVNDHLLPALRSERQRLDHIDAWYRWRHEDPVIPRQATPELRALLELARTPWLGLVVTKVAQSMYVDGYRSPESNDDLPPWRLWQRNDLDGRQIAVHRAMLAYGSAYLTVLPGVDGFDQPMAVMRGVSPRKMLAFYADPAEDDWPMYALRMEPQGTAWMLRLYDDEAVHFLGIEDGDTRYIEPQPHGVGVCPVVRFANQLDLEGRADGEVEPFIALAKRIDRTAFDRLLTQYSSSWKVRTIAGMAEPDDEEDANRKKLQLRQDDILVAEDPDTKFGSLPETPLDGFIRAYESDIKTLAAASQTPVHDMVGDLVNLNAEALAAARSSLDAKVAERKKAAGKFWDQSLKLASRVAGDLDAATDALAHVTWADTSVRSLAEAADAYGKMATMLGIPVQGLWPMIPGVSRSDVEEWKTLAEQGGGIEALMRELAGQTAPPGE